MKGKTLVYIMIVILILAGLRMLHSCGSWYLKNADFDYAKKKIEKLWK